MLICISLGDFYQICVLLLPIWYCCVLVGGLSHISHNWSFGILSWQQSLNMNDKSGLSKISVVFHNYIAKVLIFCGLVESYKSWLVVWNIFNFWTWWQNWLQFTNQHLGCSFALYMSPISKVSVLLFPGYIVGWLRNIRHKCSFVIISMEILPEHEWLQYTNRHLRQRPVIIRLDCVIEHNEHELTIWYRLTNPLMTRGLIIVIGVS